MNKTLFIFRHGQTDWNKAHRWQGHVDIALNESGIEQAKGLAVRAAAWGLDGLLSSDLSRAMRTAHIVATECGIDVKIDSRLREGAFGDAEGLTKDEIIGKYGVDFLRRWYSYEERHLDLNFPNGESRRQIITRFKDCLYSLVNTTPWARIGISTHGGVLKQFLKTIAPDFEVPTPIPNCSAFEVNFDQALLRFNLQKFWNL